MVPNSMAGRVIAGLTAVAGVSVGAIGVAIVSVNFRESYLEERAKVKSRHRKGSTAQSMYMHTHTKEEVRALFAAYQQHSRSLLDKLSDVTNGNSFRELSPMLEIIQSHTDGLTRDLHVFISEVLPEDG